jgi:hypothetical protein
VSDWADVKRVPSSELAAMVGRDFVSRWLTVDQARIDAFAKITEDEQFIHDYYTAIVKESLSSGSRITLARGRRRAPAMVFVRPNALTSF